MRDEGQTAVLCEQFAQVADAAWLNDSLSAATSPRRPFSRSTRLVLAAAEEVGHLVGVAHNACLALAALEVVFILVLASVLLRRFGSALQPHQRTPELAYGK